MRRVCTRAASNGRWCRGPRLRRSCRWEGQCPARKDEGERTREILARTTSWLTEPASPLRCSPSNANLLAGPVPTWRLSRGGEIKKKKKDSLAEKPGMSRCVRGCIRITRESANLVIILQCAHRARACATVKSSLVRTANNGCTLSTRNGLSSCTHSLRQSRKWEMHALSFKLINIGSAV